VQAKRKGKTNRVFRVVKGLGASGTNFENDGQAPNQRSRVLVVAHHQQKKRHRRKRKSARPATIMVREKSKKPEGKHGTVKEVSRPREGAPQAPEPALSARPKLQLQYHGKHKGYSQERAT